jgi:hypothetical protein
VVPLGVSRHNPEPSMRPHTPEEAAVVVDTVHDWQEIYLRVLGRRLVFAADEYYLMAGRPFPEPEAYEGFPMHEDGVGMARTFELEFTGRSADRSGPESGFFAWSDGVEGRGSRYEAAADYDAPAEGYRAVRVEAAPHGGATPVRLMPRTGAPLAILTGPYGARVIGPLVEGLDRSDVRVLPVDNGFFGGNVGVTGLMVGEDIARTLADQPAGHRYLLPDVCLSGGRFLDGTSPADLPHPVEVVPTDGHALRAALEST